MGPMLRGKTPPVGLDKHGFYKRGLKGRLLFVFGGQTEQLLASNASERWLLLPIGRRFHQAETSGYKRNDCQ